MQPARFPFTCRVLVCIPRIRVVRDKPHLTRLRHLLNHPLCFFIQDDILYAQLRHTPHPAYKCNRENRKDEERCDFDTIRAFHNIDHCCVEKHQRDDAIRDGFSDAMPTEHRNGHGHRCTCHEHQNAGSVSAALGIDVCLEDNCHHNRDGHKDHHEWACCTGPLGCHPVAWEVARDDVQQTSHRAGAGKPQNRNRRDVVKGPKALAIKLIRKIGKCTAIGGFVRLECLRWNQHCCDEAARDQVDAHHKRRTDQQLFRTSHPAGGHFLCVILIARNKRHHSNTRLEP